MHLIIIVTIDNVAKIDNRWHFGRLAALNINENCEVTFKVCALREANHKNMRYYTVNKLLIEKTKQVAAEPLRFQRHSSADGVAV